MPSDEPNKKMDDLLKAYATKRREQPPPELHAVSRKLLQEEIRRTFGGRSPAGGGHFWNWPRVAVGMCAAGLVIVVGIISFRAPLPASLSEFRIEQRIAPSSVSQLSGEAEKTAAPAAATAKAVTAVQAPMSASAPSAAAVNTAPPAFTPMAGAAPPRQTVASPPAETAQAAPAPATAEPPILTLKRESLVAGRNLAENLSFAPNAQQFVQVNNSALKSKTGPGAATVLATFQMERQGQSVRIVDGDGSVYNGKVLGSIEAEKLDRQKDEKLQNSAKALQSVDRLSGDYSFEVSGVNNLLKRNVVFTGNVVQFPQNPAAPQSDLLAQKKQSAYGSAPAGASVEKGSIQPNFKAQNNVSASLQNSNQTQAVRVTGKVQVGGGEFEIEAQPPQP